MKKSIGIIAAMVLSASVYSQNYDPTKPHQSSTSQSDSPSQSFSSRSEELSPGSAEFDAQSSLRAQGDYNNGAAKQGLTLSDEEAAQTLRNSDDVDLANRNQEQGLTDPDRVLNENNDSEPDMIYEEWILITPEDVGGPAESESGTNAEKNMDVPAHPEWGPEEEFFSQYDQETGDLNQQRIYDGSEYSQDYVGGPGQSQSGSVRSHEDDCEVEKNSSSQTSVESSGSARDHDERNVGGPGDFESQSSQEDRGTVRSSGSAVDHDERYRINRSESDESSHIYRDDDSSLDNYRGTDAQNESETITEPSDTDTNRIDSSRDRDDTTTPPDL